MSTHPLMGSRHFLLCVLLFAQVSSHTESQWLPTILATPGPGHEMAVSLVEYLLGQYGILLLHWYFRMVSFFSLSYLVYVTLCVCADLLVGDKISHFTPGWP